MQSQILKQDSKVLYKIHWTQKKYSIYVKLIKKNEHTIFIEI